MRATGSAVRIPGKSKNIKPRQGKEMKGQQTNVTYFKNFLKHFFPSFPE